tara:strand:+ start:2755 stop:3396 length:642 start_codon:yes stop_codon:yes gene_type:complete
MKVKLKETQLQKLHFLFKEQKDIETPEITGPFRCIIFEPMDMGGDRGAFYGKNGFTYFKWVDEGKYDSGEVCGEEDKEKNINYVITRVLKFSKSQDGTLAIWNKTFWFTIKVTTKQCVDGKIKNSDVYVYTFGGNFDCTDKGVNLFNIMSKKSDYGTGVQFLMADPETTNYIVGDAKEKLQEFFNNTLPVSYGNNISLPQLENKLKNIKFKTS